VFGLNTNRGFLVAALGHTAFADGEATTSFIERYFPPGSPGMRRETPNDRTAALAAVLLFEARKADRADASPTQSWSSTGAALWPLPLSGGETHHDASVKVIGKDRYLIALGNHGVDISIDGRSDGIVRFTVSGLQQSARFIVRDGVLHLDLDGVVSVIRETILEGGSAARHDGATRLVAPMNGAIVAVLAKAGDRVVKGRAVVVLESMKMQHEISVERDGVIEDVLVKPGDQVATRQLLAVLKPETAAQPQGMGVPRASP
jgi:geranyl-CoA carboxylase alpha subunit